MGCCNLEYGRVNCEENFAIDLINIVNFEIDIDSYSNISLLVHWYIVK